ncbi:MAG: hypothetical protein FD149_1630 [Rhodospirillaceae bacterium]|nr:MAG: hypothetical protein FD149_1630 [Rhodospirillaceae bacterium]
MLLQFRFSNASFRAYTEDVGFKTGYGAKSHVE